MKKLLCIIISLAIIISAGSSVAFAGSNGNGAYMAYNDRDDDKDDDKDKDDKESKGKYDRNARMKFIMQMNFKNPGFKQGIANQIAECDLDDEIIIFVKGKLIRVNPAPVDKSKDVLVSPDDVKKLLDAKVKVSSDKKVIKIEKNKTSIVLIRDNKTAAVNGREVKMDVAAQKVNNKLLLPLKFIAEQCKIDFEWYKDIGIILIDCDTDSEPTPTPTPKPSSSVLTAKKVSGNIAIDGNVNEASWNLSASSSKVVSGKNNNFTLSGALWDNNYLYIGVIVYDGNLYNDSGSIWQDDSIELYFDFNHNHGKSYDKIDRQFIKGYNDGGLYEKENRVKGVLHASSPVAGGYGIELAIPWSNMDIRPVDGMTIGFDVANNDDDNGGNREGQAMWAGNENDHKNTEAFGDLNLSPEYAPGGTQPTPSPTPNPGTTVTRKTGSVMNVDGILREASWDVSTGIVKITTGTNNNITAFGTLWDNNYLYVGAKVYDGNVFNDSTDVWDDDGVEVYIDSNHNHTDSYDSNDRQFIKSYNDGSLFEKNSNTGGVLHAWTPIAGGYSVELAIPWNNLGLTPYAGMSLGFDVGNNDDDNGNVREGQSMWAGTVDNYRYTSAFGDLLLSPDTAGGANVPTPAPTTTPAPTPAPAVTVINDSVMGKGLNEFEYSGTWYYNVTSGLSKSFIYWPFQSDFYSNIIKDAYNNDIHWTMIKDSYFKMKFKGTNIKLYGIKGPMCGMATVTIDNLIETTIDCYDGQQTQNTVIYNSPVFANGEHTITVRLNGSKNNLSSDYLIAVDRTEIAAQGQGTSEALYEAEDALLTGGASVATNHKGYSGKGFVQGYWNPGAATTFTVSAATTGNYNAALRYSNASGVSRTISVFVNGNKVRQLTLDNLKNWDTWAVKNEVLALNQGNNTIAYKYDTGDSGNVNIDNIKVTAAAGTLSGSAKKSESKINLTEMGKIDWAHWGLINESSFNRKNSTVQQISNFTKIGNGTVLRFPDSPVKFTWKDGTPDLSAFYTTSAVCVSGVGNGFQLTIPAGTAKKTLKLYVGAWKAKGKLEVALSDGSSAAFTGYVDSPNGIGMQEFTIDFKACSDNQTITIKYVLESAYDASYGNIVLQGAALR